jgi:phosphoglycerol transferase
MHRSQADVEIYALRPFELFVPGPRHRIDAFAAAAERHRAAALAVGEFPSMYLGVVGGAAFIWLMVITLRSMLLAKRVGWARFGLFSAWLIFVAMDGGAMQMLQAISGQVLFRSNNRVSIVLFMFALLFLARLLTRASTTMGLAFVPLCIVLIACGVADQTPTNRIDPNVPHWETVVQREKVAEADEKLVAAVEQRLPVGAAIYQLPPIQFPEAGFYGRLPDYDQFRPYLFSKTLRFSYGNMKGRPEANWQNEVAAMSETQRLAELSRRGFGAIYVLKNAYAPQQIEQFLNSMRAQGHSEVLESEYGDSLFVLLNRGAAGR